MKGSEERRQLHYEDFDDTYGQPCGHKHADQLFNRKVLSDGGGHRDARREGSVATNPAMRHTTNQASIFRPPIEQPKMYTKVVDRHMHPAYHLKQADASSTARGAEGPAQSQSRPHHAPYYAAPPSPEPLRQPGSRGGSRAAYSGRQSGGSQGVTREGNVPDRYGRAMAAALASMANQSHGGQNWRSQHVGPGGAGSSTSIPHAAHSRGGATSEFPKYPQQTVTRTDSSSEWAIRMEQACQTLEGILGSLFQAILIEESRTHRAKKESPKPPFSALACLEMAASNNAIKGRLPMTIRKRVEVATVAVSGLASKASSLTGPGVLAGEIAMKSVLQDCIKASNLPSVMKNGSPAFLEYLDRIRPEIESQVIYFDTLISDCKDAVEAERAREQAGAKTSA